MKDNKSKETKIRYKSKKAIFKIIIIIIMMKRNKNFKLFYKNQISKKNKSNKPYNKIEKF